MVLKITHLLFLACSATLVLGVSPSTLDGKAFFGYQGWFLTPNDGADVGFRHWSKDGSSLNSDSVNIDIWPDLTEYPAETMETTDLVLPDGNPASVFSSLYPAVMDLHFKWLQEYNLDGVFLQRFLGEVQDGRFFTIRNTVTTNMMASAEKYGRTFAIMYDISGLTDDGFLIMIKNDWRYLTGTLKVTKSKQYQHHDGKPVVTIWGPGFTHIDVSPKTTLKMISYFKRKGCYVIGGVPFYWRSGDGDSRSDYHDVYSQFDALSPWAVGRFDDDSVQSTLDARVPDKKRTYSNGQYYAPVLFPGFSWANMNSPDAPLNQIPRLGGKFLLDQANSIFDNLSAEKTFLYFAMFDEMDEGTAFFKAAPSSATTPVSPSFVTMDIDGDNLPSDYYLQLAQQITTKFKQISPTLTKSAPIFEVYVLVIFIFVFMMII